MNFPLGVLQENVSCLFVNWLQQAEFNVILFSNLGSPVGIMFSADQTEH